MRFRFKEAKLQALYETEAGSNRFSAQVVENFFEVVAAIDAAKDERDLRALKSRRFEQLQGKRKGQCSMRLHDGFRLVFRFETDDEGKVLLIIEIIDYHK